MPRPRLAEMDATSVGQWLGARVEVDTSLVPDVWFSVRSESNLAFGKVYELPNISIIFVIKIDVVEQCQCKSIL